MYDRWLSTCTEKQLFVFLEVSVSNLVEAEDKVPLWSMNQEELIIAAMEQTTRFGVPRTESDFNSWYNKHKRGWYSRLSSDELGEALKEMPWGKMLN
jgi:hypothetical protein